MEKGQYNRGNCGAFGYDRNGERAEINEQRNTIKKGLLHCAAVPFMR